MTAIDPHSQTWIAVDAWARQRLADMGRALESPAMLPEHTAFTRGQIAAIRQLLAIAEPPQVTPQHSGPDYGLQGA